MEEAFMSAFDLEDTVHGEFTEQKNLFNLNSSLLLGIINRTNIKGFSNFYCLNKKSKTFCDKNSEQIKIQQTEDFTVIFQPDGKITLALQPNFSLIYNMEELDSFPETFKHHGFHFLLFKKIIFYQLNGNLQEREIEKVLEIFQKMWQKFEVVRLYVANKFVDIVRVLQPKTVELYFMEDNIKAMSELPKIQRENGGELQIDFIYSEVIVSQVYPSDPNNVVTNDLTKRFLLVKGLIQAINSLSLCTSKVFIAFNNTIYNKPVFLEMDYSTTDCFVLKISWDFVILLFSLGKSKSIAIARNQIVSFGSHYVTVVNSREELLHFAARSCDRKLLQIEKQKIKNFVREGFQFYDDKPFVGALKQGLLLKIIQEMDPKVFPKFYGTNKEIKEFCDSNAQMVKLRFGHSMRIVIGSKEISFYFPIQQMEYSLAVIGPEFVEVGKFMNFYLTNGFQFFEIAELAICKQMKIIENGSRPVEDMDPLPVEVNKLLELFEMLKISSKLVKISHSERLGNFLRILKPRRFAYKFIEANLSGIDDIIAFSPTFSGEFNVEFFKNEPIQNQTIVLQLFLKKCINSLGQSPEKIVITFDNTVYNKGLNIAQAFSLFKFFHFEMDTGFLAAIFPVEKRKAILLTRNNFNVGNHYLTLVRSEEEIARFAQRTAFSPLNTKQVQELSQFWNKIW